MTSLDGLDQALLSALGSGKPCVLDVHVDSDEVPWTLRSRVDTLRASFAATGQ